MSMASLGIGPAGAAFYMQNGNTDVTVSDGGTGASNAGEARRNLGAAPNAATFIVQTTQAEIGHAQVLADLATGLLQVTTATGVLSSVTSLSGYPITVLDSVFTVQDNTTPTKQWQLQLSGITAGQTRTWTAQDSSGTPALLEAGTALANQRWTGYNEFVEHVSFSGSSEFNGDSTYNNANLRVDGGTLTLDNAGAMRFIDPSTGATLIVSPASVGGFPRSLFIPDVNGTMAADNQAMTWGALQTFPDNCLKVVGSVTASKTLSFETDGASANADAVIAWTGAADATIALPPATCTLAGLGLAQEWDAVQTFDANSSAGNAPPVIKGDGSAGDNFLRLLDEVSGFYTNLRVSGSLTADRGILFPNTSGTLVTGSSLSSGRVALVTTGGALTSDSDLTFATDTLTATKIAATTFTGNITLSTKNIVTDTTTGTQIATAGGAAGQKLGFFGTTPIVQPLLATGAGATVDNVITALQNLGLVRQT